MTEARYKDLLDLLEGRLPEDKAADLREAVAKDEQLAADLAIVRLEREMQDALLEDEIRERMKRWQEDKDARRGGGISGRGFPKSGWRWLLLLLLPLAAGAWWLWNQSAAGVQPPPPAKETPFPAVPAPPGKTQPSNPADPVASFPASPVAGPEVAVASRASEAELLALVEDYDFMPAEFFSHSSRGAGDDLARADLARRSGEPATAIELYARVAGQSGDQGLEASWNLGLLYFQGKQYAQALPWLEQAASNEDFVFGNDARYLLVLCCVATRQFRKAQTTLGKLLETDYFEDAEHRSKAGRLMRSIEAMAR